MNRIYCIGFDRSRIASLRNPCALLRATTRATALAARCGAQPARATASVAGSGDAIPGVPPALPPIVSGNMSHLGAGIGSTGNVTVSVRDSSWTMTDALTIGLSGQGTLTIEHDGQVATPITRIATSMGSSGVPNLNGNARHGRGLLEAEQVERGLASAALNFNGGVPRATRSELNYLSGLTVAVGPEGAWLDTQGYDITVSAPFLVRRGRQHQQGGRGQAEPARRYRLHLA